MKQVTAVEWQFEQLFNSFEKYNNKEYTFNEFLQKNLEIREQSKEMEKQQMIDFAEKTRYITNDISECYTETFKSE
jgi:hypothetical protein